MAALKALHLPAEALQIALRAEASDARFLAGAVPQPEDWLHAWSVTKRGLSNRLASATSIALSVDDKKPYRVV